MMLKRFVFCFRMDDEAEAISCLNKFWKNEALLVSALSLLGANLSAPLFHVLLYSGFIRMSRQQQDANCQGPSSVRNGDWNQWSAWTTCTVTCGGGLQSRRRQCTNPAPKCGGRQCVGQKEMFQNCASVECCDISRDGAWNMWSLWSSCPATCGGWTQRRTRECNNPQPLCSGRHCPGSQIESKDCGTDACCANLERIHLAPLGPEVGLNVGDELIFNCTSTSSTVSMNEAEIVWEYQNRGSTTWNNITNSDRSIVTSVHSGDCTTATRTNLMRLLLTSAHDGRKYQCILKIRNQRYTFGPNQYTIHLNSTIRSLAAVYISVLPNYVRFTSRSKFPLVIVLCRAGPSSNLLVNLGLSYRPTSQPSSATPTKLAVTEEVDSVTVLRTDRTILVSGNLHERFINYTILKVTCAHEGTYFCRAQTQLSTTTGTTTEQAELVVQVDQYQSVLESSVMKTVSEDHNVTMSCSTLVTEPGAEQILSWKWQFTQDNDPDDAEWTDVSNSVADLKLTIETDYSNSPCFNASVSILSIEQVIPERSGRFYRCYLIFRNTSYDKYAGVYELKVTSSDNTKTAESSLSLTVVGIVVGHLLAAVIAVVIVGIVCTRWKRSPSATEQQGLKVSLKQPEYTDAKEAEDLDIPPFQETIDESQSQDQESTVVSSTTVSSDNYDMSSSGP